MAEFVDENTETQRLKVGNWKRLTAEDAENAELTITCF
jgi:hypothetical protein